jgi:glycopeptide antibiotics resistance protein
VLRRVYVVCLLAYSGVIAWVTLRSLSGLDGSPDLIPFLDTWRQMRDYGDRATVREVASNFVLFVPFGYLLAASWRRDVWTVAALAGLASVAIEVGQWAVVGGRNPSVDDVIYNCAGAVTGAVVYSLVRGALAFRRGPRGAPASPGHD